MDDRAVHVGHGTEIAPVHRPCDLRVAEHAHGESYGGVIRAAAFGTQSVGDFLLHHDRKRVYGQGAFDKTHDERSRDVIRKISHHLELSAACYPGKLVVFRFHDVAEDHFHIVRALQSHVQHAFQPLVHFEGIHFFRARRKPRGKSPGAGAYLHYGIRAFHSSVRRYGVEQIAVEYEILSQRFAETEPGVFKQIGDPCVFQFFPPRSAYRRTDIAHIKSVPKTKRSRSTKDERTHPHDKSRSPGIPSKSQTDRTCSSAFIEGHGTQSETQAACL